MGDRTQEDRIREYATKTVRLGSRLNDTALLRAVIARMTKTFSLLPPDALELFLSEARRLYITVMPDTGFPFGMKTKSEETPEIRRYAITMHKEHMEWSEDLFIGAMLHELGHVAARRPPEQEWPRGKKERAEFKERLEARADALVWKWGLRHYSMRHLTATYPEHYVERIVKAIAQTLLEEDLSWNE
ncbi:MAG: hypothetical protein FJ118_01760 [Deltaproteobacteria bacterium]|nr:hypothetical protein [Deltaproteobacteria bacterium]